MPRKTLAPNEATASQAQGRESVGPTIASSGVGFGAACERAGIVAAERRWRLDSLGEAVIRCF